VLLVKEPPRRERLASNSAVSLLQVTREFLRCRATLGPLYLAMAVAAIGDYSIYSWTPALLTRKFALSADQAGLLLGTIAAAGSVAGTLGAGIVADRLAKGGGPCPRLRLALIATVFAITGGLIGLSPSALVVLVLMSIWVCAASAVGTIGITVVQELLPNDMRGVGCALISFGNTILGLGLGPTLVALCTDHIYRDPHAVGAGMTLVVLPVTLITSLLFRRALLARSAPPIASDTTE
jgi:MFS family permease